MDFVEQLKSMVTVLDQGFTIVWKVRWLQYRLIRKLLRFISGTLIMMLKVENLNQKYGGSQHSAGSIF